MNSNILNFSVKIDPPPDPELDQLLHRSTFCAATSRGLRSTELRQLMTLFYVVKQRDRGPSRSETSPLPGYLLQRVIERMQDVHADLDLRTLAAETGYSERHFIRMFRATTGQTPHRFLVQLRLERATRLLQQRRASLIDVAASCGFSSHAHMTQVFRRVLGVTPSEYRNAL